MENLKRKHIVIFLPTLAITIFSVVTMIKSFDSDKTWRIICATIGFIGFISLTSLYYYYRFFKNRDKIKL